MREFNLLIWVTQLGLSAALPLTGFVLLGVWLHKGLGWGVWTIPAGLGLGLLCAVQGFRNSLRAMEHMGKGRKEAPPPASFNHHD